MATREQVSSEKIDKLIGEVSVSVGSFNSKVQEAAIAIVSHAETFGDCSRAKVLARAVPSRLRNMLIGWFSLYSPIGVTMGKSAADDKCRFNKEESVTAFRVRSRVLGADKFPLFHLDGAKSNMWFDDPSKSAPEPKPLNTLADTWQTIDKFFSRLLEQARKDEELIVDGKRPRFSPEDRPVIIEMAADLKQLVTKYRNKQLADLSTEQAEEVEEAGQAEETAKVVRAPHPKASKAKSPAARKAAVH